MGKTLYANDFFLFVFYVYKYKQFDKMQIFLKEGCLQNI
jgi:hypothetical protein